MRKFVLIAVVALSACLGLSACNKQGDDQQAQNARQLQGVQDTVARGVLPGNLLAFGGPSSAATSEFVIDAFKNANPGSFKDVIVVFIGDKADEQKVTDALKPTGATFRFVEM